MTSLSQLLRTFETYAWRLEARDTYDVSDERDQFDDFLAGRPYQASAEDIEWQESIRAIVSSGRRIGRVRLVGRPVTPYTRFEFAYYPDLVASGEDVRILDRLEVDDQDPLWRQDFWLFDDRIALLMHYSEDGEFRGTSTVADVEPFIALRRMAMSMAVPLSEYTLLPDPRIENETGAGRHIANEETRKLAH